ncbi:unnamed protein product [Alternaria alternata]
MLTDANALHKSIVVLSAPVLRTGALGDTEIIDPSSSPLPAILPKTPKPRPRQPLYRGKDEVKRAVTNPNLRAILADKSYPKERRKAAGERPVLKMGISKEYK